MVKVLMDQEITILQKYRFCTDLKKSFDIIDLLDDQFLMKFMKNLADVIKAPSEKAAASIFIKRYSFVAVMSLYAMSVWNKKIDISLDKLKMELPEKDKEWLPLFSLKEVYIEDWKGTNRTGWRRRVFHDLFAENICLLIEKFEKTFHISSLVLWENIAVYLFWLYETELKDIVNNQISEDFRYLILEAEGQLFGRYNENPLQKYFSEKTYASDRGEEVRVRKTCCFNYQLQGSLMRCKTCPCTYKVKGGRCLDGENFCSAVEA